MHLVFATSIVPAEGNPTTGYEIANAAIVEALRRTGARVSIIGFIWPGRRPAYPDSTVILGEVDVRTDSASGFRKVAWLFDAVQSGTTFASAKLHAAPASAVRAALAGLEPIDGYILNAVTLAGAFETVFTGHPSIFIAHNAEFRTAEDNAAAATSLIQKTLYRREARLLRAVERRLCDRAAFTWTLADDDRATLGLDPARSAVLPLVVGSQPPVRALDRKPSTDIALIGSWTWQANRIGLDWFLGEVVPRLPSDIQVRIAGKAPADMASDHPGVRFVGFVPDAAEFVRTARVVPLISRVGTGVQLKTIETFELGLPCVATSSALRGIAERPVNCILADDPGEFARLLVEAVRNPMPDVDGGRFYAAQRAQLDSEVVSGLAALDKAARSQVAA